MYLNYKGEIKKTEHAKGTPIREIIANFRKGGSEISLGECIRQTMKKQDILQTILDRQENMV